MPTHKKVVTEAKKENADKAKAIRDAADANAATDLTNAQGIDANHKAAADAQKAIIDAAGPKPAALIQKKTVAKSHIKKSALTHTEPEDFSADQKEAA